MWWERETIGLVTEKQGGDLPVGVTEQGTEAHPHEPILYLHLLLHLLFIQGHQDGCPVLTGPFRKKTSGDTIERKHLFIDNTSPSPKFFVG